MVQTTEILASTWQNGLFVLSSRGLEHELRNRSVRGLSSDLRGGVLAVVDEHDLYQRVASGDWVFLATSDYVLSVTFALGNKILVGTDDARVLQLGRGSKLEQFDSFDSMDGRASWYAGTFVVDGETVGPPLGIRSLSGSNSDNLFASVHVGGIPRSTDGGTTWIPTIDIDLDVHEVRVSPYNSDLVVAATAAGLCISWDAGTSWSVHAEGLRDPYCSAVSVTRDNIFVAASEGHFSKDGAIYRQSLRSKAEPIEKVGAGLPTSLDGIADTACIASLDREMALVSAGGEIYESADAGLSWQKRIETVLGVSSVQIVQSIA